MRSQHPPPCAAVKNAATFCICEAKFEGPRSMDLHQGSIFGQSCMREDRELLCPASHEFSFPLLGPGFPEMNSDFCVVAGKSPTHSRGGGGEIPSRLFGLRSKAKIQPIQWIFF